jgi:hypothetical protein
VNGGRHAARWFDATLYAAAALSLLAALIHLWVVPEHLEEWWGYGAFFLVCAGAQGLFAFALLRRPDRPLLLGVAGNLSIVILWFVTRTTGVPLGPHAGDAEVVGALDLACALAEAAVVVGLGALVMRGLPTERRIQVVVVTAVSAMFFWHLLHLLALDGTHHESAKWAQDPRDLSALYIDDAGTLRGGG